MRHYASPEFSFVFELQVPLGFLPGRGGTEQRHRLHGAVGLGLSGAKRKSKTDRILPFPSCEKLTPSKVFPPPLKDPPISCALTYSRLRQRIWGEGGLPKVVERASGVPNSAPSLSLLSALEKGVPPSGEGKSQRLLSMRM